MELYWPKDWRTTFKHGVKTPYCLGLHLVRESTSEGPGVIRVRPINLLHEPNPTIYIDIPDDPGVIEALVNALKGDAG